MSKLKKINKYINLLSYMTRKAKVPHISEAGARKCLAFVLGEKPPKQTTIKMVAFSVNQQM